MSHVQIDRYVQAKWTVALTVSKAKTRKDVGKILKNNRIFSEHTVRCSDRESSSILFGADGEL